MLTDPARLLVTAAHPRNVEIVIADGRVLKRAGVLTAVDVAEVTRSARAALSGVLARAAPESSRSRGVRLPARAWPRAWRGIRPGMTRSAQWLEHARAIG